MRHALMSTYDVHPLVAPWQWPTAILYPVAFLTSASVLPSGRAAVRP